MIDTQHPFSIANITISPKTDEMSCDGETIEIKSMTMKMICYFASRPNEVVTREQLRENIWINSNASDHTINNHIYTLRQVFANFDKETKFFHTVTGSDGGYRLLIEVKQVLIASDSNGKSKERDHVVPSDYENKQQPTESFSFKRMVRDVRFLLVSSLLFATLLAGYLLTLLIPKEDKISLLTVMPGREQSPTISDDGSLLLFANRTNRESSWELYASRLSAGSKVLETQKVFSDQSRNENYVSISPNKKHIAFIRYPITERGIYLADFNEVTLTATNTRLIIPLDTSNLSPTISWLNNTQFFYTSTIAASAPRKVYKYDLVNKRSEPISAPPLNTFGDFAAIVSPNKRWLAILRSDTALGHQLFLYNLRDKTLSSTQVTNNKNRRYVSFSDDSKSVYFIDKKDRLSEYFIEEKSVEVVSNLPNVGYWPLKVPGKNQIITQQDWGLSSMTNRIIRINNPQVGGDGKIEVIVDNGLSMRSIANIGKDGLIFASITPDQKIELWKYQQGKSAKLDGYNYQSRHFAYLSLDWLKGSDKAILSINNTCHLIDINTGKDSPLCPANESLYAGKFSQDSQSIYLVDKDTSKPIAMGLSGYPVTEITNVGDMNSIHESSSGDLYYSEEPTFDIYHFDRKTSTSTKLIERTFVIDGFSNNDFVLAKTGIYFMDRKSVRNNAIYFYDFSSKEINLVVASKDNYPHIVLSEDEKFIYLIESYDSNTGLSLVDLKGF